jgi:hypothetical protein
LMSLACSRESTEQKMNARSAALLFLKLPPQREQRS